MLTLDKKILDLKQQIKDCKSQLKPSFRIEDDCEYQEQLELRWHIDELEAELDKLLEQNRAEEEIEGWG
jgi:hypothetical protein